MWRAMTATPSSLVDGQLPADLLGIHIPQADDLVVEAGVLGHLVIVGGQQGDGVDVVEIPGDGLDDDGALVGVGAPGELIQQEQGVALLHLRQRLLELDDLGAEAADRPDWMDCRSSNSIFTLWNRGIRACLAQTRKPACSSSSVEGHGLHGHGLAAHVGAGDHR